VSPTEKAKGQKQKVKPNYPAEIDISTGMLPGGIDSLKGYCIKQADRLPLK